MGCVEELALTNTTRQKECDFFRLYPLQNISCEITEPSQTSLTSTQEFVVSKPKITSSPHWQIGKIYTSSTHWSGRDGGRDWAWSKLLLRKAISGIWKHPRTPGSDTWGKQCPLFPSRLIKHFLIAFWESNIPQMISEAHLEFIVQFQVLHICEVAFMEGGKWTSHSIKPDYSSAVLQKHN